MKGIKGRLLNKLKFIQNKVSSQDPLPYCYRKEEQDLGKANEENKEYLSLYDFEEKCPPGGKECVVLYTTSLRGVRKTFEDCNTTRVLLESFGIQFHKRDVSMHMEYREELWKVFGGRVIPPSLFIKGRYIGGAEEVVTLNEKGKLKKLLQGIPSVDRHDHRVCDGCGGYLFVLCLDCNGSRKVFTEEEDEDPVRCLKCNENGLTKCPICC